MRRKLRHALISLEAVRHNAAMTIKSLWIKSPRKTQTRLIVYTAIVGGYDQVPTIARVDPKVRYVCFSDLPLKAPHPWEEVRIERRFSDPKVEAGYYRTHPHEIFGTDAIVVWVDGNYREIRFNAGRIRRWLGNAEVACLVHPSRRTAREEADAVERFGLASTESVERWRAAMVEVGFPDQQGLAVTSLTIRDLRSAKVVLMNDSWWWSVKELCRRDQLGFPYATWVSGVSVRWILIDALTTRRWFHSVDHSNPVGRVA